VRVAALICQMRWFFGFFYGGWGVGGYRPREGGRGVWGVVVLGGVAGGLLWWPEGGGVWV